MSPTSISTCPITCSSSSNIEARGTFFCSTIISIMFSKSTSTFACTCFSLTLHRANAPFSTLAYTCSCIFLPSKLPFTHDTSHVVYQLNWGQLLFSTSPYFFQFAFTKDAKTTKKTNFLTNTRKQTKHPHQLLLLPNTTFSRQQLKKNKKPWLWCFCKQQKKNKRNHGHGPRLCSVWLWKFMQWNKKHDDDEFNSCHHGLGVCNLGGKNHYHDKLSSSFSWLGKHTWWEKKKFRSLSSWLQKHI